MPCSTYPSSLWGPEGTAPHGMSAAIAVVLIFIVLYSTHVQLVPQCGKARCSSHRPGGELGLQPRVQGLIAAHPISLTFSADSAFFWADGANTSAITGGAVPEGPKREPTGKPNAQMCHEHSPQRPRFSHGFPNVSVAAARISTAFNPLTEPSNGSRSVIYAVQIWHSQFRVLLAACQQHPEL